MNRLTKITLMIIAIIIGVLVFKFTVFANNKQEPQQDFDTTFRNHRAKAWEYKLQEIKHNDKAIDLEIQAKLEKQEAEKARVEKEKLLFGTGDSWKLSQ